MNPLYGDAKKISSTSAAASDPSGTLQGLSGNDTAYNKDNGKRIVVQVMTNGVINKTKHMLARSTRNAAPQRQTWSMLGGVVFNHSSPCG